MKTKSLLWMLTLSICNLHLFAQTPDVPAYGEINEQELVSESYLPDPDAETVILLDINKTRFERDDMGIYLEFKHRRRIKFYGEPQAAWANVEIQYFRENARQTERIRDIKAYVVNFENGKMVQHHIDRNDVFEDDISDKWKMKKFAFPQVKAGSIIEYEYTKTSPYKMTFDWKFQHEIPVKWSQYQIDIPPFYNYQMELQGDKDLSLKEQKATSLTRHWGAYKFNDGRYTWGMSEVPAFGDEPFITTRFDYLIMMKFQLAEVEFPGQGNTKYLKDWPDFVDDFLSNTDYGKNLGKKTGKELVLPYVEHLEGEEKAREIYRIVSHSINWNERHSRYPSESIKDVLEEKEGNSSDINIWLCNMLNAAGLKATPVLLSTRDHGKINVNYPFLDDFNSTIVYLEVEDKGYLLDASSNLLRFGMIHPNCLNEEGLILDKKNPDWINLDAGLSGYSRYITNIIWHKENNSFEAIVSVRYEGYDAVLERNEYLKGKEAYQKRLSDEEVIDFSVKNLEDIEKPFIIKYKCEWPVTKIGDQILLDPFFLEKMAANPFKLAERNFAIDFTYKKKRDYFFSLAIPEGYELESFPENTLFQIKDKSVSFNQKSESNYDITLNIHQKFEVKNSLIHPSYYQELKQLYDRRVKAESQPIVLQKKL